MKACMQALYIQNNLHFVTNRCTKISSGQLFVVYLFYHFKPFFIKPNFKNMSLRARIVTALQANKTEFAAFPNAEAALTRFVELAQMPTAQVDEAKRHWIYWWNKVFRENTDISARAQAYAEKGWTPSGRNPEAATELLAPAGPIDIRTFTTAGLTTDDAMFKRWVTNSEIDDIFSDDGGVMAGTSNMIVGGPGVGKTTLALMLASRIKEFNPEAKVAIVSSEMEKEDLIYEAHRKPWINQLEFILTSEYENNLKDVISAIFKMGNDVIILDSFQDICDKLKDFCGMTSTAAENWLMFRMKKTKGGDNDRHVYTAFIAIQQQTKGGVFAGSNKIKHGLTAMFELHREPRGDRYCKSTKNRRCGQHVQKKLYYYLGANNHVMFDSEKWDRELANVGDETAPNAAPVADTQALLRQYDGLSAETMAAISSQLAHPGEAVPADAKYCEPFFDEIANCWIMEPTTNYVGRLQTVTAETKEAAMIRAALNIDNLPFDDPGNREIPNTMDSDDGDGHDDRDEENGNDDEE